MSNNAKSALPPSQRTWPLTGQPAKSAKNARKKGRRYANRVLFKLFGPSDDHAPRALAVSQSSNESSRGPIASMRAPLPPPRSGAPRGTGPVEEGLVELDFVLESGKEVSGLLPAHWGDVPYEALLPRLPSRGVLLVDEDLVKMDFVLESGKRISVFLPAHWGDVPYEAPPLPHLPSPRGVLPVGENLVKMDFVLESGRRVSGFLPAHWEDVPYQRED